MSDEYGFPYDPQMVKELVDTNDSSAYGYIPEIPRIFLRSHIFGGSHMREERKVYVFNNKDKKLEKRTITTPKLEERLFLEILSNAVDNSFKSQRMGIPANKLEITMNSDTISITSFGVPIPVDIHPYFYNQNQFGTCAELIFGVIGAGGNTDDKKAKAGGGVNGYGAKITNVFSRMFEVEIGDNVRGFHQKVIWRKNMMEKVSSVITPSYEVGRTPDQKGFYHIYPTGPKYTGENFVKITWKQDFRKFGCECFNQDDLDLYMKYSFDASFTAKFIVSFNGEVFDYRSATSLMSIFPKDVSKNSLIHYEFETPPTVSGKELEAAIANLQIIPIIELIVIDSPAEGMHISYCNGIYNIDGGEHTDVSYREILRVVKEVITSSKSYDKELDLGKIDIRDLKKHASIIVNFKCIEASFKGQDKEKLLSPTPKIKLLPEEAGKIKKWTLINSIYTTLTGKYLKDMAGKGVLSGKVKGNKNFKDANWVIDPKNKHNTVLILCEGNSAGAYILKWILGTPERENKYAVLFLQGKFNNVTDKDFYLMLKNKEIANFVQYMGLEYGVDYSIAANIKKLRYQKIFCMVDADSDGSHIQSLVINFIYRFFPSILISQLFYYVKTPVYRVLSSSGKTEQVFYDICDYKKYVESIGGRKHIAKFFKGLASSKDSYAKEDARSAPIILANFDDLAAKYLDVAFKKGLSTERKRWIEFWRDKIDTKVVHSLNVQDPRLGYVNISDYINTKLVEYSIDTFSRALPSYKDGLKKSQRQVLWHVLEQWNYGHSKGESENIETIACGAKTSCKYHHGDLTATLARFGSDYPGSNNVTLLYKEGQFGTRDQLGKDIGESRYVETKPESIVKMIFDKELTALIENKMVDGKYVEPKWLPTKIPLHIVNGVLGVATAYSIEIPAYHPVDVIIWMMNYLSDNDCFPLIPWYRGFKGKVELEINHNKYKKDKDILIEGQEMINYYEGLTLKTTGIFKVLREREQTYSEIVDGKTKKVSHKVKDILISEIPIDIATSAYVKYMDEKCDNIISQRENADEILMVLEGWKDDVDEKELKMVKNTGLCNISLVDDNAFPFQMRNVYETLKLYCDNMKTLYENLKLTRLKTLEVDIIEERKKIKVIDLIRSKAIITDQQDESFIEEQLAKYGIEIDIYNKLSRRSESKQGYAAHLKKLDDLEKEYILIRDKHHLAEWFDDLNKLLKYFNSLPEYNKLEIHKFPYVPTKINDLLSGKVKSPFIVKEEVLPNSI